MIKFLDDPLYGLFRTPLLTVKKPDGFGLLLESDLFAKNYSPILRIHRENPSEKYPRWSFLIDSDNKDSFDLLNSDNFTSLVQVFSYFSQMSFLFPLLDETFILSSSEGFYSLPPWSDIGENITHYLEGENSPKWFGKNADPTNPYTPFLKFASFENRAGGEQVKGSGVFGRWEQYFVGSGPGHSPVAHCEWWDVDSMLSLVNSLNNPEVLPVEVALADPEQASYIANLGIWSSARENVGKQIFPPSNRVDLDLAKTFVYDLGLTGWNNSIVHRFPETTASNGEEVAIGVSFELFSPTLLDKAIGNYDRLFHEGKTRRLNLLRVSFLEKEKPRESICLVGNIDETIAAMTVTQAAYRTRFDTWAPIENPATGKLKNNQWDNIRILAWSSAQQEWHSVPTPSLESLV